jgi:AIPR protein
LIETQDDDVKEAIVKATNRQTELTTEQLYALTDFARQLEMHFKSVPENNRLFYERREGQYDRFPTEVPKSKIVTPQSLIRAFGAMFLDEPTRVTRNYRGIREKVGKEIFAKGHRLEPYYIAAYA